MSKNWPGAKPGERWQRADRIAVARRFRSHIDTPSNRRRNKSCRIQRRNCHWHPYVEAEGHHVDYNWPFVVVWVGLSCGCHRKIEHGTLKIPRKAIWDYTSLIEGPYGISKPGLLRKGMRVSGAKGCTCGIRGGHGVAQKDCPVHNAPADEVKSATPF
jgi:hypothetical protein